LTEKARGLLPFAISTVVLCAWFLIWDQKPEYRNFQADSERLVTYSVERSVTEGVYHTGGFMALPKSSEKTLYAVKDSPYTSQYALHYKLYALGAFLLKDNLGAYFQAMRFLTALALAITLGAFIQGVKNEFGVFACWLTLGCIMFSGPVLKFSMNLYWVLYIHLLPFVFAWLLYERMRDKKRLVAFYIITGVMVALKSLCGYEYLTSVVLAPIVCILYYEMKARVSLRIIIKRSVCAFLSMIAGFVVAFAMHFHQALRQMGSFANVADRFRDRAAMRTVGGEKRYIITDIRVFFYYFKEEILVFFPANQLLILLLLFVCFVLFCLCVKYDRRTDCPGGTAAVRPLAAVLTLVFAFGASLSWNIIAWGHMRYHLKLNCITFFMPFNLLAFAFCGYFLHTVISGRKPKSHPGVVEKEL